MIILLLTLSAIACVTLVALQGASLLGQSLVEPISSQQDFEWSEPD